MRSLLEGILGCKDGAHKWKIVDVKAEPLGTVRTVYKCTECGKKKDKVTP